jgi:hypothetical protein
MLNFLSSLFTLAQLAVIFIILLGLLSFCTSSALHVAPVLQREHWGQTLGKRSCGSHRRSGIEIVMEFTDEKITVISTC